VKLKLGVPEMLLALQTVLLVPFLVSMVFRMKGNYLVHGIIMIVLVAAGWFATIVSLPNFMDNSFMEPYMSTSSTLAVAGSHMFFGVATYFFGTWLVALWRPRSTDFAAKSKRIWQTTAILWILAYVVGLLLYVAVTTNFL
jgi:hypothetical protein